MGSHLVYVNEPGDMQICKQVCESEFSVYDFERSGAEYAYKVERIEKMFNNCWGVDVPIDITELAWTS